MYVQPLEAEGGTGVFERVFENDTLVAPYFGFVAPNGLMASWGLARKIKDKSIMIVAMLKRFFLQKNIVQY